MRRSLVNISETIAGDRSNQFGLLTEDKCCSKLSMDISIDSCYCNRFITLGRPIFPLNYRGASAVTVFTIPKTFGIAHARCYTRAKRADQSATQVWSSLLDSLNVPSTYHVPKIVFTFSPISRACTNSIAIYSIITRDLIFFLHRPAPAIRLFFWLAVIAGDGRGRQRNQARYCAMTWAFHVLQKICRIKLL